MIRQRKFAELPDAPKHVIERLSEKPWAELETLEHSGSLLFPETIHKPKPDGSFDTIVVRLRVPRDPDIRQARIASRTMAKREGLDTNLDADLIEEYENIVLLASAIRSPDAPFEPWEPDPAELEKKLDKPVLAQIWAKLDALSQNINPQPAELDEATLLALIAAIAKERSILPLHVCGPVSQAACILYMADRLVNSPDWKSYLEQSDSSTQEASQSPNS